MVRPARSALCPVTGASRAMQAPAMARPTDREDSVVAFSPKAELVR